MKVSWTCTSTFHSHEQLWSSASCRDAVDSPGNTLWTCKEETFVSFKQTNLSTVYTVTHKHTVFHTLQLWSSSNLNLTDWFQHRCKVWTCCTTRSMLLHPWSGQFSWWLHVNVLHVHLWKVFFRFQGSRCVVGFVFSWVTVALRRRAAPVLENSEDHLDVLLSLKSANGKRLFGYHWHGVNLKDFFSC